MSESIIISVDEHSVCAEMGVEPGDVLLSVNNQPVLEIFDYRYLTHEDCIDMLIRKPDGEEWLLEIEKDEDEDLGLVFEHGLMDEAKHCTNKCIFCFIDQLPKNMRPTLYFKDDDTRLSFLSGNYITMTNISDSELKRILYYHLSPINISVHATDPNLRAKMLNNPEAANLIPKLKQLFNAGIAMNYQVVLCKGYNDGSQLDKTIHELAKFIPLAKSLSIVPAGLTKYRDNLPLINPLCADDSEAVLHQIKSWQIRFLKEYKTRFVFAADELYLNAGTPYPSCKAYEGFPQLENGVGMLALFEREFQRALKKITPGHKKRHISLITGAAAYSYIRRLCSNIQSGDIIVDVHLIDNNFFGEKITVSGLLTGRDILEGLKDKQLGEKLLIPANALRDGCFLDNVSLEELSVQLKTEIIEVKINGLAFAKAILQGDIHA
jgi:putative radical SAM enzyme (TIGR03279 family)